MSKKTLELYIILFFYGLLRYLKLDSHSDHNNGPVPFIDPNHTTQQTTNSLILRIGHDSTRYNFQRPRSKPITFLEPSGLCYVLYHERKLTIDLFNQSFCPQNLGEQKMRNGKIHEENYPEKTHYSQTMNFFIFNQSKTRMTTSISSEAFDKKQKAEEWTIIQKQE